ncbi:hypothetical protein LSH36_21g08015 [Paralvinella palmiformis]|uniref:Uncharacterized protein n=1 Tax=Paralvinella palmiformis TaxID=53620 RepID=A0AAD9NFE6_9ANNE|nr:hypothetical protein LSH36_21g08015 [Paralvinella palmiformis]
MAARQAKKQERRETAERSKLQKKLQKLDHFPDLDGEKLAILQKMLEGTVVGLPICHVWTVDGSLQIYNGKIEKLKVGKSTKKNSLTWNAVPTLIKVGNPPPKVTLKRRPPTQRTTHSPKRQKVATVQDGDAIDNPLFSQQSPTECKYPPLGALQESAVTWSSAGVDFYIKFSAQT